jgi:arsenical pump membrane protein
MTVIFPALSAPHLTTWAVVVAATAGVIVRPGRIPEAVWALAGALTLLAFGLVSLADAWRAIGKGLDVYLFLTGMMILAELARREGLFDYMAAHAVRQARGSAQRLFALVYAIGIVVTVLMSNDATAVVLTPAVYAAAKKAGVKPLPYLLACAFVANAASFVLPISNPANLVIFGNRMPTLVPWLAHFALPSAAAIAATYVVLRWLNCAALRDVVNSELDWPALSSTGTIAGIGVVAVAGALIVASAFGASLGWPTLLASTLAVAAVLLKKSESPAELLRQISWGVLPLVACLFVLVEAVAATGVVQTLTELLQAASATSAARTAWVAGGVVAVLCNVINNLPAGLIAGSVATAADVPVAIRSAIAIGVDLGPNLSVTGSLATILWLVAIRREGENVSAWQFMRVGAVAMPVALILSLGALYLQGLYGISK